MEVCSASSVVCLAQTMTFVTLRKGLPERKLSHFGTVSPINLLFLIKECLY